MPKIDKMYANLCGAKIFTTLGFASGYYHIGLDKDSPRLKLHSSHPLVSMNLMQFLLVWHKHPAYFQQLISIVLQDCGNFAMAYLR